MQNDIKIENAILNKAKKIRVKAGQKSVVEIQS